MRRISILILLLLFTSTLFAVNVFTEYSAVPAADRVTITWITKSETNIHKFVVLRSNDNVNYIELHTSTPKGPGTRYEFIDENVMFKGASKLFYKVKALDKSGTSVEESSSLLVIPNMTSIGRTWGTLKAIFR